MRATNRSIGNRFEQELCALLSEKGFWVHAFAQNSAGQPADVIAVKKGQSYLIDCKVCMGDRFPTSRIEENQRYAMKRWCDCGNGLGLLAIKIHEAIYMITIDALLGRNESASVDEAWLMKHGSTLNDWTRWVDLCVQ